MSIYHYIAQRRAQVCVQQLCQVLRIGPSAYYAWQRRQKPAPEPAWQVAVRNELPNIAPATVPVACAPSCTPKGTLWARRPAHVGGRFRNLSEARLEISQYIAYYNAERRHSALGYLAPNHFETNFLTAFQLSAA